MYVHMYMYVCTYIQHNALGATDKPFELIETTLRLQLFTCTKFSDFCYYADLNGI